MTVLRITRPDTDRHRTARLRGRRIVLSRVLVLCACAAPAGLTGCGSDQPNGASPAVTNSSPTVDRLGTNIGPKLPGPEADRIEYNPDTRTLTFYDPPGDSRWMVHHPGERHPVSVGPEHRVPNGADPNQTMVYFTRGGQSSAPVSLRQIQDGQGMHASNKQQP